MSPGEQIACTIENLDAILRTLPTDEVHTTRHEKQPHAALLGKPAIHGLLAKEAMDSNYAEHTMVKSEHFQSRWHHLLAWKMRKTKDK